MRPGRDRGGRPPHRLLPMKVRPATDDVFQLALMPRSGVNAYLVGDVIVDFNGAVVKDSADLPLLVARTPVGEVVKVKVLRGTAEKTVDVKVQELKDEASQAASAAAQSRRPRRSSSGASRAARSNAAAETA